jgi:hypothetical protein
MVLFGSSSALHEDNRYIRSSEIRFGKRLKYALESSFLARDAAYAAADFGVSMGVSAGWDVAREFLPNLFHRKLGTRTF